MSSVAQWLTHLLCIENVRSTIPAAGIQTHVNNYRSFYGRFIFLEKFAYKPLLPR